MLYSTCCEGDRRIESLRKSATDILDLRQENQASQKVLPYPRSHGRTWNLVLYSVSETSAISAIKKVVSSNVNMVFASSVS